MSLQLDLAVTIGVSGTRVPLSATSVRVASFTAQVKRLNAAAIFVGGGSVNNDGSNGIELPKPTTNVTCPAFGHYSSDGSPIIELADWFINGTAGDGVNIIAVTR